jgi:DNA modification methylase
MKLKQAILSVMGRDALKAAVDELEIEGVDRRSREEMRARISRTHRATPELLIERLSEAEVKVVCELIGVDSKGRRSALVESLLHARPEIEPKSFDQTDVAQESEPVRWMRPEEVEMTEQPTDKPKVQWHGEPVRPFEITRTELVWPGKYDERGKLVEPPRVSLPFQVIEVIEEGRTSREGMLDTQMSLFSAKPKSSTEEGWRNKLIWGDNLLVEASLLKNFAGKIDLIYIDPPFATGADFSVTAQVGEGNLEVTKDQSAIEAKVYRDTWNKGVQSYLGMLYGRLILMRDLLSQSGSIFVHVDYHIGHYVKAILDDIFGEENFRNEIIVKRRISKNLQRQFEAIQALPWGHDNIYWYSRANDTRYRPLLVAYDSQKPEGYWHHFWSNADRPTMRYELLGVTPRTGQWKWSRERALQAVVNYKRYEKEAKGRSLVQYWEGTGRELEFIRLSKTGKVENWFAPSEEQIANTLWTDIHAYENEKDYATQKHTDLLIRVIAAASEPGQLVADFFCGSGTTCVAAEELGRRWIGCDLGRFAIHTTRKRLLDLRVKDSNTGEERGCRPFEVLNLGRYERKYWQGITFGNEPRSDEETALAAYVRFILELYKAQPVQGSHIHGKKGGAFVHVGAVDAPVTISQIEDASAEAQRLGGEELHILGWEFEMGLHDPITQYVRAQHGVIVRLLSIPRETMEKRAVEAGDVQFFDLAYLELEIKPEKAGRKERTVKVVLKDFVIPSTDLIPDEVRAKIRKWSDYIDYWAVDWDFRNDTFVNQWQTYRTRQNRSLALETPGHTFEKPGAYQILVKVVDIFGNDTSHLVRWEVK